MLPGPVEPVIGEVPGRRLFRAMLERCDPTSQTIHE